MGQKRKWGEGEEGLIEKEIKLRILLTMAAYGYEFEDEVFISDAQFDSLSLQVNPSLDTGNELLDKFFREEFNPSTGSWIQRHPELDKVKQTYHKYYKGLCK